MRLRYAQGWLSNRSGLLDRGKKVQKMAIALLMEFPDATQEQYDRIMQQLGMERGSDDLPRGLIFHVAGPTDKGWQVIDVWESRADFNFFLAQRLGPAIRASGLVPTTPKEIPVYNVLGVRFPAHVSMIGMVA
jgi:hypothetical protein